MGVVSSSSKGFPDLVGRARRRRGELMAVAATIVILLFPVTAGCLGIDNMAEFKGRLGQTEPPPEPRPPEGAIGASREIADGRLSINASESVTLFATRYGDPQNLELTFLWDLAILGNRSGESVTFTTETAGTYRVTLTIKNSAGLTRLDSLVIEVRTLPVNTPPVARFVVRNAAGGVVTSGNESEVLTFDPADSEDAEDGTPAAFEWNFGDGSPRVSERVPVKSFLSAGLYEVTLTVTDSDALNNSARRQVAIDHRETLVGELSATKKTAGHNFSVAPAAKLLNVTVSFTAGTGAGVNDLDLRVYDAAGNEAGNSTRTTQPSDGGRLTEYVAIIAPATLPAGGWRALVELRSGIVVDYEATITVTY